MSTWKLPVRVASTINLALSGEQIVDGITLVAGDRILVKDQSNPIDNGLYIVSAALWTRTSDLTQTSSAAGTIVYINEGTTNGDKTFVCSTNPPNDIVGTNSLTFSILTGGSNLSGNSLVLNGTTSGSLTINPAAVTTTYSVTMPNAQGAASTFLTNDGAGNLTWSVPAGGGDVTGPASSTDNAIPTFNGTSGKILQNNTTLLFSANVLTVDNAIQSPSASDLQIRTLGDTGARDIRLEPGTAGIAGNRGGDTNISCGTGNTTGRGGACSIQGGNGGSTNGIGGSVTLTGGNGNGSGNGGNIVLNPGTGGVNANPGNVNIMGGISQTVVDNPYVAGSLALGGIQLQSLWISGNYVYIADRGNSVNSLLHIVDITNPLSPQLVSSTTNTTIKGFHPIMVQGKYAYLGGEGFSGSNEGVAIYDISNPTTPVQTDTQTTSDAVYGLWVCGKYMYVCTSGNAGANDFYIFDISDPTNIVQLSANNFGNQAQDLTVQGKYAYVVYRTSNTLSIIDISNPASPSVAGTVSITNAYSVAVNGFYAFVLTFSGNSIVSVDVSDPTTPTIVQTLNDFTNLNNAYNLRLSGNYAYIMLSSDFTIVNISNPAAMTITSRYTLDIALGQGDVYVSGLYAYICGINLGTLYAFNVGGTQLTNTSAGNIKSNNIDIIDTLQVGGSASFESGVQVNNSLAILSDLSVNGTATVGNITQTPVSFTPTIVGSIINNSSVARTEQLAIQNNVAFLARRSSSQSVVSIDISNPSNPVVLQNFSHAFLPSPQAIVVSGEFAYVSNHGSGGSVTSVHIANPSAMNAISGVNLDGSVQNMYLCGQYLYAVTNQSQNPNQDSFFILDISNPENLDFYSQTSFATPLDILSGVWVYGDWAFISSQDSVSSVNVSNPVGTKTISQTLALGTTNEQTGAITGCGQYVYIIGGGTTASTGRLTIVNISNPTSMSVTGTSTNTALLAGYGRDVEISGNLVYTSAYDNNSSVGGIIIFDVTNKSSPTILTSLTNADFSRATTCALNGLYAYIATDENTNGDFGVFSTNGVSLTNVETGLIKTGQMDVCGISKFSGPAHFASGASVYSSLNVYGSIEGFTFPKNARILVGDIGGGTSGSISVAGYITSCNKVNDGGAGTSTLTVVWPGLPFGAPSSNFDINLQIGVRARSGGSTFDNDLAVPISYDITNTGCTIFLEETTSNVQNITLMLTIHVYKTDQ